MPAVRITPNGQLITEETPAATGLSSAAALKYPPESWLLSGAPFTLQQGQVVNLSGAGGTTIDLTAAPVARDDTPQRVVDLTGYRYVGAQLFAPNTNNQVISLADGAVTPFKVGSITLHPGDKSIGSFPESIALLQSRTPVSAAEKNLDINGDAGDFLNIIAIFALDVP